MGIQRIIEILQHFVTVAFIQTIGCIFGFDVDTAGLLQFSGRAERGSNRKTYILTVAVNSVPNSATVLAVSVQEASVW